MPKGNSGIKRSGGGSGKTGATPVQKTPEEVLADNIKVVEKVAERGLMHKGVLYYGGTAEQRTKFYEAVDRAYKRMPEGYSYTFLERSVGSGKYAHYERHYQVVHVRYENTYILTGKHKGEYKRMRRTSMVESPSQIPKDLTSQSALRGYAKAQVFRAAGKIYDPNVKGGVSEEYQPL